MKALVAVAALFTAACSRGTPAHLARLVDESKSHGVRDALQSALGAWRFDEGLRLWKEWKSYVDGLNGGEKLDGRTVASWRDEVAVPIATDLSKFVLGLVPAYESGRLAREKADALLAGIGDARLTSEWNSAVKKIDQEWTGGLLIACADAAPGLGMPASHTPESVKKAILESLSARAGGLRVFTESPKTQSGPPRVRIDYHVRQTGKQYLGSGLGAAAWVPESVTVELTVTQGTCNWEPRQEFRFSLGAAPAEVEILQDQYFSTSVPEAVRRYGTACRELREKLLALPPLEPR